jgi:Fe-S-cluster containining protein
VAPDISTLKKPVGVRCSHLDHEERCGVYDARPAVCRNYTPDELCLRVAAPTLAERVAKYLSLFALEPSGDDHP